MPMKIEYYVNDGNAIIHTDDRYHQTTKIETVHTKAELDEAVNGARQEEREACAETCLMLEGAKLDDAFTDALEMCADSIRKRGEK